MITELKSALGALTHRIDTAKNFEYNIDSKYFKLSHGWKVKNKGLKLIKLMLNSEIGAHISHPKDRVS